MGWIKIHSKMLEWEWFTQPETAHLFLTLLLKANWEDNKWRGITIPRGSILIGRKALALASGLSEQQVRTALKRLEIGGEIEILSSRKLTTEPTNGQHLITICKYDSYQDLESESNQQSNQRPTSEITNYKRLEDKKEIITKVITKKDTTIEDREQQFATDIRNEFSSQYPAEMLEDFIRYWTEPNKSRTKMRWELEKVFDIKRRLITWSNNNQKKYQDPGPRFGCPTPQQATKKIKTIQDAIRDAERQHNSKPSGIS